MVTLSVQHLCQCLDSNITITDNIDNAIEKAKQVVNSTCVDCQYEQYMEDRSARIHDIEAQ